MFAKGFFNAARCFSSIKLGVEVRQFFNLVHFHWTKLIQIIMTANLIGGHHWRPRVNYMGGLLLRGHRQVLLHLVVAVLYYFDCRLDAILPPFVFCLVLQVMVILTLVECVCVIRLARLTAFSLA